MIAALGLLLTAVSVLIQWLNFRRTSHKTITPLQKRQLAHAAARCQAFLAECSYAGIEPHADESVTPKEGDEDEPDNDKVNPKGA